MPGQEYARTSKNGRSKKVEKMDSSKEYIEMCRAASEIQEIRKKLVDRQNNKGRFTWFSNDGGRTSIRIYIFWGTANYETHDGVWLPMQHQLQERLFEISFGNIRSILKDFVSWCDHVDFDSMEKLWLTFWMFKIYFKSWDGINKKWVEGGS